MMRLPRERARELLFDAPAFGEIENHTERPRVAGDGERYVDPVVQPPRLPIGGDGPELNLVVTAFLQRLLPRRGDIGAVIAMHLVNPEPGIREPAISREAEDLFRPAAHEREVAGRRVDFPEDGAETLDQLAIALFG